MEYNTNAKMMLGYIDDDEDEILDYDGNLDLSTDNDEDEEAESMHEYQQPYPETPEEKILWQEQIRMIHLRSHLNQLLERVKHAQYVTDKTREELKKCRGQIQHFESERDNLFSDIQNKESAGNQSAVHRVRATHERICQELEAERALEKLIIDRLDQAEYDLAIAEVERGKFILAEDDLLQREHQLSKEKTDMAMVRLHKEEQLARQALITRRKDHKVRRDAHQDAERRHMQAVEEAERSHERANKYLQKTLAKLEQRQKEEADRYKSDMSNRMDMLLKLRKDITHNRENLKAIRARDKAAERKEHLAEQEERREISAKGGNPEEILLMKKRRNEVEKQKQQFDAQQKVKKTEIMQRILEEEKNLNKRKKQQPHLWDSLSRERSKMVGPHPLKPLQALDDYMRSSGDVEEEVVDEDKDIDTKEKEILKSKTPERAQGLPEQTDEQNSPNQIDGEGEGSEVSVRSSTHSYMEQKWHRQLLRKFSAEVQDKVYVSQTDVVTRSPSVVKKKDKQPDQKNKNKNRDDLNDGDENDGDDDAVDEKVDGAIEDAKFLGDDVYEMDNEEKEKDMLDRAEEVREEDGVKEEGEEEEATMQISLPSDRDADTSDEGEEVDVVDLAKPEFEGLWDRETKPYHIPKETDIMACKPVGGSKMDKEILQKTLERTREGIVVTQMAAGREFSGCPFYSKPDVIHFKDFVVGKTYKKRVTLTNVSYTVNYIKFLQITERLKDFIQIHFDPPGQMSAGLTCEMMVTFKPMINEDLKGEVSFLTQTGPFNVPLICSTKKCDLVLDTDSVDFGTTVIGETMKRTFTLTNHGALGTKFDFFKVTGMKQRTLTTAGTSLGQMEETERFLRETQAKAEECDETHSTKIQSIDELLENHSRQNSQDEEKTSNSMRAFSPDSATGPPDKSKPPGGSSVAVDSKKKSEEALDKIPEGPEGTPPVQGNGEGSEGTEINGQEPGGTEGGSEQKDEERDSQGVTSPDLAVSEMDDYASLDGMRVGPLVTGEIGPFSSLRLEIIWQPTIPGKVDSEFMVSFADPLSEQLPIRALANAIDVPVWVERQTVDLKICMFDRLYQDTIIVNNRATTALRLKFEVCKELKNHLELLPKTGYIQAQSQFSAQLKFLPRHNLFEEASKFFDPETGVLEAPLTIRVADQTTPVDFTVQAVVTNSDMEFDVTDIDFGHCTVHESVKKTIKLTNKSILPQKFGFVGLPEYVEVQPNDGFGTLLPLETIELDVIFSPRKTREYNLDLVCRSLINRDFHIQCKGVGVLTPLELTHQVVHFAATPLYDVSTAAFHVANTHTSSNEFTHPVPRIGKGEICPVGPTSFEFQVPPDAPITVSPCVGTIKPGQKQRIQVRFSPTLNDYDVRQEALRLFNKQEAAREEKEREEAALREKMEKETNAQLQLENQMPKKKNKNKNNPREGADENTNAPGNNMQLDAVNRRPGTTTKLLTMLLPADDIGTSHSSSGDVPYRNDIHVSKRWSSTDQTQTLEDTRDGDVILKTTYERAACYEINRTESQVLIGDDIFCEDSSISVGVKDEIIGFFCKNVYWDRNVNHGSEDDFDSSTSHSKDHNHSASRLDKNSHNHQADDNVEELPVEVAEDKDGAEEDIIAGAVENAGDKGSKPPSLTQDLPNDDQGSDASGAKGKGKDKQSPKTGAPQAKTSKLSAAPSSTGSAITQEASPRFDPDKLARDSAEYQAAVTSLVRQFKGQFQSFTIPCCVASGTATNPGELDYSIHNTLYLSVHCPAIKPPIVVISEGGRRTVDFGDVSIGQTCPRSVTVQNISDKDVELHASALNPGGPFLMLNALRALPPGGTHTILLTFAPEKGQVFQEEIGISTVHNTLHLTLRGNGVSPLVSLTVEDEHFDMSAVLVSEYVEKIFKIQNTSTLAIDYVIKQDSLSPLRYQNQQEIPAFLDNRPDKHYVGTQNDNGRNVFDIIPTTGTIQAGEAKEITVTFAPDHESDLYSDGVRIELFDQDCQHYGQEESHFFRVTGQAKPRVIFLEGVDKLVPGLESLAQQIGQVEEEDPVPEGELVEVVKPKKVPDGKGGAVISPPALVTVHSVMENDTFTPGVREIYAGCVRTMAVSQKKNGEFTVEGIQGLVQKGFTIEPQKGMVEAGSKKPIVITWTPPPGYDPNVTVEETATITLKCDVTEQIPLMIRAMVVTA